MAGWKPTPLDTTPNSYSQMKYLFFNVNKIMAYLADISSIISIFIVSTFIDFQRFWTI
jgi:hypothetical protein